MDAVTYRDRGQYRLAAVAEAVFRFSEGHFSRLFAAQVGVSFSEYLRNTRLRHVKELLIHTGWSISEIAI
ncbi:MAG: helix-turn-helix domain-containing protein, partial [Lachnospiraceae bacterium]|nr:helix-turn-helix domain-containing protein [Lachnospiraceae bacterium]